MKPPYIAKLEQFASAHGYEVRIANRGDHRGQRISIYDPTSTSDPHGAGFEVAVDYQLGSTGPAPHSHGDLVCILAQHGPRGPLMEALFEALAGLNGGVAPARSRHS